jgi:MFS family permease
MIPLKLFQLRDVAISAAALFFTSMILIGLTAYLPLWTQNVLELGATASGLTLIPLCIGWPLAANLCGQLIPRFGTRKVAIFGASLITTGSFSLTFVTPATSIWVLGLMILVVGLGFGFAITVFTVVIQSSVQIEWRGAAGSVNTLMRTLGQTLGVAILGAAMYYAIGQANGAATTPAMMADGLHTIFVISAVISVISLIVTVRIPQREEKDYAR